MHLLLVYIRVIAIWNRWTWRIKQLDSNLQWQRPQTTLLPKIWNSLICHWHILFYINVFSRLFIFIVAFYGVQEWQESCRAMMILWCLWLWLHHRWLCIYFSTLFISSFYKTGRFFRWVYLNIYILFFFKTISTYTFYKNK